MSCCLSLLGAKGPESGWLVSLGQWQEGTLRSSVPGLPAMGLAGTVVTTAVYVSQAGSHSPWSISWRRRCIWDMCVCVCVCGCCGGEQGGSYIHSCGSILLVGSRACGCFCEVPWTQEPARRPHEEWRSAAMSTWLRVGWGGSPPTDPLLHPPYTPSCYSAWPLL